MPPQQGMEAERPLRTDQIEIVRLAIIKQDQLGGQLGDIQDVPASAQATEENGHSNGNGNGEPASLQGLETRVAQLSRFIANNITAPDGSSYLIPEEVLREHAKEKKIEAMSRTPKQSISIIQKVLGYMIKEDGVKLAGDYEASDGYGESVGQEMREELKMSQEEWQTFCRINDKLEFIDFERKIPNGKYGVPYKAARLNMEVVTDIAASGKLSEHTVRKIRKFEKRLAEIPDLIDGEIETAEVAEAENGQSKVPRYLTMEGFRDGMIKEARAKNDNRRVEDVRRARFYEDEIEIDLAVGDESFSITTSGKTFSELDDELQVLILAEQARVAKTNSAGPKSTEVQREEFVLEGLNVAKTKGREITGAYLKILIENAVARGELKEMEGFELPGLTKRGLVRIRQENIKRLKPSEKQK